MQVVVLRNHVLLIINKKIIKYDINIMLTWKIYELNFFVEIDNSFFNSDIFQFERSLKKYNSNIILSIVLYIIFYIYIIIFNNLLFYINICYFI